MRYASPILAGCLALALAAPVAAQQDADGEDTPPGADEYTRTVQRGIAALMAGDRGGATDAFRDAIQMDGNRPAAIYYLAAANRMAGNLEEALSGFERAGDLAEGDARWRGRAMQAVAETLERMEGRLEDARSAWQAYVRFADANQAVCYPAVGRARIQAIDIMLEQERAYEAVRRRIREREEANRE